MTVVMVEIKNESAVSQGGGTTVPASGKGLGEVPSSDYSQTTWAPAIGILKIIAQKFTPHSAALQYWIHYPSNSVLKHIIPSPKLQPPFPHKTLAGFGQ
jgi:hypothetical protein